MEEASGNGGSKNYMDSTGKLRRFQMLKGGYTENESGERQRVSTDTKGGGR